MSKAVSPMRVLIVDDDRAICDYMQTLLSEGRLRGQDHVGPGEALADEVKNGGYHLIILDLMMPKLDGIEVLQRIRKVDNDVAVGDLHRLPEPRDAPCRR